MKPANPSLVMWLGFILGGAVWAEQAHGKPYFPPPEWVGDWKTIREKFIKWEITEFNGWVTLEDYSTLFRFTTSEGAEIGLLHGHGERWIEAEKKPDQKPIDPFAQNQEPEPPKFFLYFGKKVYRVQEDSENEAILLAMLDRASTNLKGDWASHPKYMTRLCDYVKTRKTELWRWPMTEAEFEGR